MKKLLCLIGHPVKHSVSPSMHNKAFETLKMNYVYLSFDVYPGNLDDAVKGLKAIDVRGFNVTIPYKEEVIGYLDHVDLIARRVGAVNTVVNSSNSLIGYNTDVEGVETTLRLNSIKLYDEEIVVLGAGGAARAAVFTFLSHSPRRVTIINRTFEKAKEVAREFNPEICRPEPLTRKSIQESLKNAYLLVNATPVGMKPGEDASLIGKDLLNPDLTVFDMIYNPLKTKLLSYAEEIGAKTVNGVDMLVGQGAASFKLWTGVNPPFKLMRKTVLEELKTSGQFEGES